MCCFLQCKTLLLKLPLKITPFLQTEYITLSTALLILGQWLKILLVKASSDLTFRGDQTKHNPEELFLSSLSSCPMLWYLHFCSEAVINVIDYTDEATGIMTETADGSRHFTFLTLYPTVTVAEESMIEKAKELHHKANQFCFIANSINFPVQHIPTVLIK